MTFDDAKRAIMQSAAASDGDNLLGMRIDIGAYLELRCPSIASVAIQAGDNPLELLTAACVAVAGASPVTVAQELQAVWLNDFRYRFREAHRLRQTATTVAIDNESCEIQSYLAREDHPLSVPIGWLGHCQRLVA